ncbi:DEAD/DEAH box helicase domain protein [Pseudopedobacter saltans DSM 12145]|uniref:DEAD/DEAH box helicase domain protein n=1 Tax=Pseudopedobacter saltans (strain ATCC 51119 / DSM 12145 / JCM 21818 / CCUG 39354 / LMG 10337 / NBRC 100064 / NCIMB 13643) TaxID=762903 RepID=F0S571_PSESL|nr:DEAD/DEAH box helicase [Pseudopedobacter saltans]ADY50988.1 DEAD/DEAH box helicase domain protein [Pseudopedobacter saltans DSM 12145]
MNFEEFNFVPELQEGLDSMGFSKATPIQEQTIPLVLQNKDIIACAQTGTGKTASYLLPVLNKIYQKQTEKINTLILVPTRELALQIDQQIMGLAYFTQATSIAVYGGGDGVDYEQQKRSLREGVNIIVATPGRIIAHLTSGKIKFDSLEHLILDEADRMLDMGFYDDIVRIISYLPQKRQNLLFSATMPPRIRGLAKKILKHPAEVNIAISKPSEGINQLAYMAFDNQKGRLLMSILKDGGFKSIIIFASKKETVKSINSELNKKGIKSEAFHSDLEQHQREEIMNRFKGGQLSVLVGTDVISRGIDVVGIDLVVNYDVPPDPEDYIHRIGRTARAEATGTAITFINDKDQNKFHRIEKLIEREIEKIPLPEELGEAPGYEPTKKKKSKTHFKKKPTNKKWGKNKKEKKVE